MSRRAIRWCEVVMSLAVVGCGGGAPPGTAPRAMSVSGHEQAASVHEAEERAAAAPARCGTPSLGPCWSSEAHPSAAHRAEIERHRSAAAAHREAAQALRDAEAEACVGIDELDRDVSPFVHREDVAAVQPLLELRHGVGDEPSRERTAGATVVFRAVPGLTAEWLQREIDCHLARNASLGRDAPGLERDPLVPNRVTARVRSVGNGFAVDIRGDDAATAREVLRRARALLRTPAR